MANLKDDLDQYLLLQSDQKKNFKIDIKMPQISSKRFSSFFGKSEPEANSFLKDAQDSCCPNLTRLQRIIGFVLCLGMGVFCFSLSIFFIPVLVLKARKFALLYTLGSLFFISSFCFLSGFVAFCKQFFSKQRLAVSLTYSTSMLATLYFSLIAQSTALTVLFAIVQIIALLFMVVGAIPGGTTGIKFFGSMFRSGVSNTLPV
ncbi:hypothetical protein ACFFRR_004230 [Megaselia abdita]